MSKERNEKGQPADMHEVPERNWNAVADAIVKEIWPGDDSEKWLCFDDDKNMLAVEQGNLREIILRHLRASGSGGTPPRWQTGVDWGVGPDKTAVSFSCPHCGILSEPCEHWPKVGGTPPRDTRAKLRKVKSSQK